MSRFWYKMVNFRAAFGLFAAFYIDNWDEHKPETPRYPDDPEAA